MMFFSILHFQKEAVLDGELLHEAVTQVAFIVYIVSFTINCVLFFSRKVDRHKLMNRCISLINVKYTNNELYTYNVIELAVRFKLALLHIGKTIQTF